MRKVIFFIFVYILYACGGSLQEENKEEKVKLMLDTLGVFDAIPLGTKATLNEWKLRWPNVPDDFWGNKINYIVDEYEKEVRELYISIYSEQYTSNEIDEILVFYNSPVGKKLINDGKMLTPIIYDSMSEINTKFNDRMLLELEKNNYER